MVFTFFSYFFWFAIFLVLQIFVFNHIQIGGYATPLPYFYFFLLFPISTPRWLMVLMGFALGLSVDIVSNTIGIAAATSTFLALLIPFLFNLFIAEDKCEADSLPTARHMGWGIFATFVLLLSLVQCTLFFLLENFSFLNATYLLTTIASSTGLTFVVVLGMERIRCAA